MVAGPGDLPRGTDRRHIWTMPRRLAVLLALCLLAATPAAAQLGSIWRALTGDTAPRPDAGFASFRDEGQRIEDALDCGKITDMAPDRLSDRRRMCRLGKEKSVRVVVFEPVGYEGLTKRVRFAWTDNDDGEGRAFPFEPHADRDAAAHALRTLAAMYTPSHVEDLAGMFFGTRNGSVSEGKFTATVEHVAQSGATVRAIEFRDGNWERLSHSEEEAARPGFEACQRILGSIEAIRHLKITGNLIPERQNLNVVYFLKAERGDRFLCEIHDSGYYRVRVSRRDGDPFRPLAHGNFN